MGTFPEITMIANEGDLTDLTFCSVQFKVKENTAATQTQVKLTKSEETGKLLLSVMGESSEDVEFEDKVVTLEIGDEYPIEVIEEKTLTKIQVTNQPTKTSYKIGEKFDTTGMKVVAKYSDGTQKVITNYTYKVI